MQSTKKETPAPETGRPGTDKASFSERFGENLALCRKAAGLTQAELAAKLNYSDKIVSKWERGDGLPDLPTAVALSEILGVPLDRLLQDPNSPAEDPSSDRDGAVSGRGKSASARGGESGARRRVFIHLLASLLPFLVAAAAYATLQMVSVPFGGEILFLYALTVSGIVSTVFSCLWWGALPRILSVSLICWSVSFSFWLSLRDFGGAAAIFTAAAVMQVLTVLWFLMPGRKKRRSDGGADGKSGEKDGKKTGEKDGKKERGK